MSKVRDPLKCGECGGHVFTLTHLKEKNAGRFTDGDSEGALLVQCTTCKKTTTIRPSLPTFAVEGYLCGGWKR